MTIELKWERPPGSEVDDIVVALKDRATAHAAGEVEFREARLGDPGSKDVSRRMRALRKIEGVRVIERDHVAYAWWEPNAKPSRKPRAKKEKP